MMNFFRTRRKNPIKKINKMYVSVSNNFHHFFPKSLFMKEDKPKILIIIARENKKYLIDSIHKMLQNIPEEDRNNLIEEVFAFAYTNSMALEKLYKSKNEGNDCTHIIGDPNSLSIMEKYKHLELILMTDINDTKNIERFSKISCKVLLTPPLLF